MRIWPPKQRRRPLTHRLPPSTSSLKVHRNKTRGRKEGRKENNEKGAKGQTTATSLTQHTTHHTYTPHSSNNSPLHTLKTRLKKILARVGEKKKEKKKEDPKERKRRKEKEEEKRKRDHLSSSLSSPLTRLHLCFSFVVFPCPLPIHIAGISHKGDCAKSLSTNGFFFFFFFFVFFVFLFFVPSLCGISFWTHLAFHHLSGIKETRPYKDLRMVAVWICQGFVFPSITPFIHFVSLSTPTSHHEALFYLCPPRIGFGLRRRPALQLGW